MTEKTRGNAKTLTGIVVSDAMDKTIVVRVERLVKHPIYKKYVRRRKRFTAHDEQNECRVGDTVLIMQSRPISRTKRWRVSKILQKVA
ncbi:30S ribosomal protein S17 [Dethiosulfatarculus sandiegensis]|jgi:small subunit ribosomal protein S17|uniref:Small ribosomal subunit protein uS17 n=1 Tax=Dethiosulfatarculus sandiegensis TaxID=1429043 RepID=A0A0D2GMV2_9BACT|nr:30S ribosomal protein S17 [Dethiosulfatarculus sandiegensis]KIX15962.1 30S ribosomal protein S17 [Dethiosulfatarculus sandiegensis]